MNEKFKLVPIDDSNIVQIERDEICESPNYISIEIYNDDVDYVLRKKELLFNGIYSTSDDSEPVNVKVVTKNLPENIWLYKSNVWVNTVRDCYNCGSRVKLPGGKSICLDNTCGKYNILADNITVDDMIELMIKSEFEYFPCIMCDHTVGEIIDTIPRINGKPYVQTVGEMVNSHYKMTGVLKDANGDFVQLYESYYEDCEWRDFTDEENDKIATAITNELVKGIKSFLPMEGTPLSSSNLKQVKYLQGIMNESDTVQIVKDNFVLLQCVDTDNNNELSFVFSFISKDREFAMMFSDGDDPLPWVKNLFFKMKELEERGEI